MLTWYSRRMYRVDSKGEDRAHFEKMYDRTPEEAIARYSLQPRMLPDHIRHIVLLSEDEIHCAWSIAEGESVRVYTEYDGHAERKYFEQECYCFFELIRDGEVIAMWVLEDSPHDAIDDEWELEEYGFTREDGVKALFELMNGEREGFVVPMIENTAFVRQL